ncbi:hypothetical protein [Peristeroidobacter soli]|uniref:hypothetical protein n=1 Tax=Peristeroidobacter soli TaxID=2497877 RepID=UPI00101C1CED|nr:hypothetical protein [Peristeroidobacter soli]
MQKEGPPLQQLLHRITATPPDFMAEPRIGNKGEVHTVAVVRDLLASKGHVVELASLSALAGRDVKADRNRLSITLLIAWLLADPALTIERERLVDILTLLKDDATRLAGYTNARQLFEDLERREELARLTLSKLGLRPAGETMAQAQDRFTSISSLERARLLAASQEAEARARAIREQLAKKAAEESANKWTRE